MNAHPSHSSSGPHWAAAYIGLAWERGAQGPSRFDCWGLVRWVLARHYSIHVPEILPQGADVRALITQFRCHPERQRWRGVAHPQDGDVALIRQSRFPSHVGLWVEVDGGGLLHATEEIGVAFQKLPDLALTGWSVEGFYRFQDTFSTSAKN